MPQSIRFSPSLAMDYEIRQRALKEGRSIGEVVYLLAQRGLDASPAISLPEAHVDRVERNLKGSKATACYLSGPISAAVTQLSREQNRSTSWTVRCLLRTQLRQLGLLATPEQERVVDADADHADAQTARTA